MRVEKTRLEVGDIIHVGSPLLKEEYSNYPVTRIDGNKAITKFRIFNTRVYCGNTVYEYGKRQNAFWNNHYTVKPKEKSDET